MWTIPALKQHVEMVEHALRLSWDKQKAFVKKALMERAVKLTKVCKKI
jgi:hypothetical protein